MVKTVSTPASTAEPNQIIWGSITGTTQDYRLKSVTEFQLPTLVGMLPVRYAISRTYFKTPHDVVKAPKIAGPFQEPGIALGDSAHYTLRRLRDGFLYLFCEKDHGWRIFEISEDAPLRYIGSHNYRGSKEHDLLSNPTAEGMLFVHEDSPIWLGFSDVKWTRKLLDDHMDEKIRAKHMRRFDPKAWQKEAHMAAMEQLSKRLAESATGIPEGAFAFSKDPFRRMNAEQILVRLSDEQDKDSAIVALDDPAGIAMDLASLMTTRFMEWTQKEDPDYQTRLVPAPDAALTKVNRKRQWTMLSGAGIEQLKAVAANRAEADVYRPLWQQMSMDGAHGVDIDTFINDTVPYLKNDHAQELKRKAKEARENAWKKYEQPTKPGKPLTRKEAESQAFQPLRAHMGMDHVSMDEFLADVVPKLNQKVTAPYRKKADEKVIVSAGLPPYYDVETHDAWKKSFKSSLDTFSGTHIKPLAEAHVAWCEHAKFRDYYNHVFDFAANDAGIGVAFTQTMSLCYAGVQDKVACWEHIKKWLEDDLKKPEDNLIVAAMLLGNQQALAHVQQAAQARTEPRSIPWDSGIKALSEMALTTEGGVKAVDKLLSERATETMKDAATAQLTAEFSGPLAAVMRSAASTKTLTAGPIAAGMASGQALIPVVIQGYLGGHITSRLTFAIRQAYPFLSGAEAQGLAAQAIDGKLNAAYRQATHERAFVVHVTPKKISEIPKELHVGKDLPGGKNVCDWLMEHGLSAPREMGVRAPLPRTGTSGDMAPLKVEKKAPGTVKDTHWTQPESNIGMTCSVLGSVLAFVGWWQLNDEAKKAQGVEKETTNDKLNFQICAATGATMDTMGKVMSTVLSKTVASGAIARKCIAFLKIGGTALGAVAGFAAAYYEFKKSEEDQKLQNKGLYVAHIVSAFVGGTATILSLAALFSTSSLIPIAGWILAAAGLVTLVIIEEMTDKIGDWLKQCSWGAIRFGDRFLTLEAEATALKGAATT